MGLRLPFLGLWADHHFEPLAHTVGKLVKMPKAGGTITTLDGAHLYWAKNDWATPGGIKKVPVEGGSPVTVLSNVTGVAVDNYSVYWTDGSNPDPIKTGPK